MNAETQRAARSVDPAEISQFSKDSEKWWDPDGPFAPLHRLNPIRLSYLKKQICRHYGLDAKELRPLKKLNILDIGCGGGIVAEPLARMGAKVTGADADPYAIAVAKAHAATSKLDINYVNKPAEELGQTFDVIVAFEVIEHVVDPEDFVKSCARLLKPGGLIIFSTLNRTAKSFALGIVAAEYVLRWVPRGTHNWKKFIKPSELSRFTRGAGLDPQDVSGLILNPLNGGFQLSANDVDVNYFLTATKP